MPLDVDTGMLKEWTIIKTTGEEPVVVQETRDLKKPITKQAPVVELDNRVRTIKHTKDFAVDAQGVFFYEQSCI